MEITIITNSFHLNEFKAFYCHRFVKSSKENGDEIKFIIDKEKIGSFVSCLIAQHLKFDMVYQANANILVKNEIILAKMEHLQRIKNMITVILNTINQSPDVTIEDLNNS
jgi:hypothetical protein